MSRALRLNKIFFALFTMFLRSGDALQSFCPSNLLMSSSTSCLVYREPLSIPSIPSYEEIDVTAQATPWAGSKDFFLGYSVQWTNHDDTVLITNKNVTQKMLDILSNAPKAPLVSSVSPSDAPYYEAEIPGKGRGLVASRSIRKGEVIMVRQPTLIVQVNVQARIGQKLRDRMFDYALENLTNDARGRLMGMVGDDLADKINKNCFRLRVRADETSDGGEDHIACYPEVALMNHDCRPSLAYNTVNTTHTVSALRDITVGEELSITYISLLSPRAKRLSELKHWGFDCSCPQCQMSSKDAVESDARLRAIAGLEEDLENLEENMVMPETGAKLVDLYKQERLEIYISRAYTQAAINYAAFGREQEARSFAQLSLEASKGLSGVAFDDLQSARIISEDPRSHPSWEYRKIVLGG